MTRLETSRPAVGVGDVLRAVAAIARRAPDRWDAIATVLGYALPDASATTPQPRPSVEAHTSDAAVREPENPSSFAEADLPLLSPDRVAEAAPTSDAGRSRFLLEVEPLAEEDGGAGSGGAGGIEPLFAPQTARSTIRAAVLIPDNRGRIDSRQTARLLAGRRPAKPLPRQASWHPSSDVLVLQDLGDGMDAFLDDIAPFLLTLRRVVGKHAAREGAFLGRPAKTAAQLGIHPGTVVIVLTDLGLSQGGAPAASTVADWREFASQVQRADARAVALVPWERRRWPAAISSRLAIVTWDRTTTVSDVLSAVRSLP